MVDQLADSVLENQMNQENQMKNPQAKVDGNKVITGRCRISFPNLFKPRQNTDRQGNPQGEPKYSVLLLIPKENDGGTLEALRKAQQAALKAYQERFGKTPPKTGWDTIHDCDEEDDLEQYPEREGHYRVSVSSNRAPGIVDAARMPILDQSEIYSGCYVRVSLDAYPYMGKESKGVSFALQNVQKLGDGEPLTSAGRSAEDDFEPFDDDEDDDIV